MLFKNKVVHCSHSESPDQKMVFQFSQSILIQVLKVLAKVAMRLLPNLWSLPAF